VPVTVQPFDTRHARSVVDLIVSIQQDEFGIPITYADQPDLGDIPGFYQRGSGNFWIALDGDRVVGSVALLDIGGGETALRKMFVAAPYRGAAHGVAGDLLATLCDHARARDVNTIYLGTTAGFLAAHRFYEKNGFDLVEPECLPPSFPRMAVDTRFYRKDL
jgi:N-acetylglutamate synthase-like GNAT family acetyltransferase